MSPLLRFGLIYPSLLIFISFIQSMVAFLKDPSGPPLWEENPEAKDVVHIETEKVSSDVHSPKNTAIFIYLKAQILIH